MDRITTIILCINNGKIVHNFGTLMDKNQDEGVKGAYDNGRNTKMHVGSIIGSKLQRIINKTSTKWMEAKYIQDIRPQTTKDFEEKRLKPQAVHKDSICNKCTNASTGANGSKKVARIPNKSTVFNAKITCK